MILTSFWFFLFAFPTLLIVLLSVGSCRVWPGLINRLLDYLLYLKLKICLSSVIYYRKGLYIWIRCCKIRCWDLDIFPFLLNCVGRQLPTILLIFFNRLHYLFMVWMSLRRRRSHIFIDFDWRLPTKLIVWYFPFLLFLSIELVLGAIIFLLFYLFIDFRVTDLINVEFLLLIFIVLLFVLLNRFLFWFMYW